MRIEFERSGGFMGLRQEVILDTNEMEPQEADEIRNMVESANFFSINEQVTSIPQAPDQFQYRLTIERSAETRHTIVVSASEAPEALQPLLRRLTLLARRNR